MNRFLGFLLVVGGMVAVDRAQGDSFGSGANSFTIDFVTIGNPGNPDDTTSGPEPWGGVAYSYRMGKYEVSEQMIDKTNALGALGIPKFTRGPDKPATRVSWFDAARFVNWLNTSTGNTPAYNFINPTRNNPFGTFALWTPTDPGYDASNLFRNSLAKYFLPSTDEWFKAAYYDPTLGTYWNYPTGQNVSPTSVTSGTAAGTAVAQLLPGQVQGPADIMQAGGLSPYGTMAQGGNAREWQESLINDLNNQPNGLRSTRGGSWQSDVSSLGSHVRGGLGPPIAPDTQGFRVASVVPEPSAAWLAVGAFSVVAKRQRNGGQRS